MECVKEDNEQRKQEAMVLKGKDLIVQIPIQSNVKRFVYPFIDANMEIVWLECCNNCGIWSINGNIVFPDETGKFLIYCHHSAFHKNTTKRRG